MPRASLTAAAHETDTSPHTNTSDWGTPPHLPASCVHDSLFTQITQRYSINCPIITDVNIYSFAFSFFSFIWFLVVSRMQCEQTLRHLLNYPPFAFTQAVISSLLVFTFLRWNHSSHFRPRHHLIHSFFSHSLRPTLSISCRRSIDKLTRTTESTKLSLISCNVFCPLL